MNAIRIFTLGSVEKELLDALELPFQKAFHAECVVSNEGIDPRPFFDRERNQYNSTAILRRLKDQYTNSHLLSLKYHHHRKTYLGITQLDLFIPILTFVFGEAELGGDVAVVSYHRLRNELYGLPANKNLLASRLVKESLHELGHVYGLIHCHAPECVMRASTYAEDIDLKSAAFCGLCAESIGSAVRNGKFLS